MLLNHDLKPGETITNRQLMNIFHCACEGGIRYSSKTGTIVLVINKTKDGFPNVWNGNTLNFAGRPLKNGFSGANKRLNEFLQGGLPVFLFEVNIPGKYTYLGQVVSAGTWKEEKTATGTDYPTFPIRLTKPAQVK